MKTPKKVIYTIALVLLTLLIGFVAYKMWTVTRKVTQGLACEDQVWPRAAAVFAVFTLAETAVCAWYNAFADREKEGDVAESKGQE